MQIINLQMQMPHQRALHGSFTKPLQYWQDIIGNIVEVHNFYFHGDMFFFVLMLLN